MTDPISALPAPPGQIISVLGTAPRVRSGGTGAARAARPHVHAAGAILHGHEARLCYRCGEPIVLTSGGWRTMTGLQRWRYRPRHLGDDYLIDPRLHKRPRFQAPWRDWLRHPGRSFSFWRRSLS
jgi:hypothetical protein